jgi:hypothetical protein
MDKRRVAVLLMICAAGLLAGVLVLRAQIIKLDFTLVNQTGVDIYMVFISPSEEDDWGEDVLKIDVLEDGVSVELKFDEEQEAELWDLKVEDEDGNAIVWKGLDLTEITSCTLQIVGRKLVAEIKKDAGPRKSA